jgi:hypothetical protein
VLRYTDLDALAAAHSEKESLMAIFDNVVIPNSKNMVKSMAGFSKNPAILFAMFPSNPAGVNMARSVPILLIEKLAFFYEKVHHPPYE